MNSLQPCSTTVKCANDSKLDTVGKLVLNVQVGVTTKRIKFIVVKRVLPSVIIGIRSMKHLSLYLNLAENCAEVNNIKLPFLG